jgi:preprotein translocase subunit SecE
MFYSKNMANKFTNFFKDIKLEMLKVSWPSRDELMGSTVIVLVSLTILSVFIGICDVLLSKIVNIIMTTL